jgi:hypothetical protein
MGNQCCKAFLEGIPAVLWSGEHLHREPYQGDNGILFKAKSMIMPDAETFLCSPHQWG